MQYMVYKMNFMTGVHFGDGTLNTARMSFFADTLFSALCHEALHRGEKELERLVELVKTGKLVFSDGMPYVGDELYITKPLLMTKMLDKEPSEQKKWKKLQYLPVRKLQDYLNGEMEFTSEMDLMQDFGYVENRNMVSLQDAEKSEPYIVGIFHYHSNTHKEVKTHVKQGLYIIMGYETEEDSDFLLDLLDELGLDGFGGKKSSGLGKYEGCPEKVDDILESLLKNKGTQYISLTTSLPEEKELGAVLKNSATQLVKRSGFVYSDTYAENLLKKRDMYFFQAGSVFEKKYEGALYDVSDHGNHPVWRYSKPIFLVV